MRRQREGRPATLLFAAAALLAGIVLLYWLSKLTWWRDEWDFLLHRRGFSADVYFDPFVEHLLALPIAIYQFVAVVFGMESAFPVQLVSATLFIGGAVLLFVYLRRRVDAWLALAAVLPILFFGPSWDDLLFPFQMAYFGSVVCGLGALLALDREDRRGDIAAAVLLTVGLLFSGLGVPFVVMAAVDIALTRERFRRAFVVAIPTFAYALWFLHWGRDAQTFISLHNFANLPGYVADGLASSISSLLGLAIPRDETTISSLDWGRPLLAVVLAFGAWRIARIGFAALPRRLWALIAGQLAFWTLTGLNASFFGQATSGRYQLLGAILWVMIGAELLRGVTVRVPALAIALLVSVLAALANFSYLRDFANGLHDTADQQRGGLAALELTRGEVDPGFVLTIDNSDVDYLSILDAGSYFSAIDAYGSPAYTPDELGGSRELARVAADKVFAAALGLRLAPATGAPASGCAEVEPGGTATVAAVPAGGARIRGETGTVELGLRRYASDSIPVDLGPLIAGDDEQLTIPTDLSDRPWQLVVSGAGKASVCGLGS